MFILFALVFMRMTGAVMFNPVLGRTNIPNAYKGALIFMLTLMLYVAAGGVLQHEPGTMVEFGVMLVQELFVGFVLGFSMELFFMVVRFASSIMDQTMGLSMAQVYDPTTRTQMELVTEAAVGILMRMIPQINVFAVNFQLKIAVGMMMLVYLFSPMADRVHVILRDMFLYMERLLVLMR